MRQSAFAVGGPTDPNLPSFHAGLQLLAEWFNGMKWLLSHSTLTRGTGSRDSKLLPPAQFCKDSMWSPDGCVQGYFPARTGPDG